MSPIWSCNSEIPHLTLLFLFYDYWIVETPGMTTFVLLIVFCSIQKKSEDLFFLIERANLTKGFWKFYFFVTVRACISVSQCGKIMSGLNFKILSLKQFNLLYGPQIEKELTFCATFERTFSNGYIILFSGGTKKMYLLRTNVGKKDFRNSFIVIWKVSLGQQQQQKIFMKN